MSPDVQGKLIVKFIVCLYVCVFISKLHYVIHTNRIICLLFLLSFNMVSKFRFPKKMSPHFQYCPVNTSQMVKGCRSIWYVGEQVRTSNSPLLCTWCVWVSPLCSLEPKKNINHCIYRNPVCKNNNKTPLCNTDEFNHILFAYLIFQHGI
jgi:hypothetical protein